MSHEKKSASHSFLVAFCVIIVALTIMVLPLFYMAQAARESAKRMQCSGNSKGIGLGFQNYYDTHKTFPPAYSVDENGKPLHSWRVLILPYMEQRSLYDKIRLDEPWDSDYNKQFHSMRPRVYACPSDYANCKEYSQKGDKSDIYTNYVRIVGEGTITNGPDSVSLDEIEDYPNKIFFVETTRRICWMEPEDLKLEDLDLPIPRYPKDNSKVGISSYHPDDVIVVTTENAVFSIPKKTSPESFKAAAMIKGKVPSPTLHEIEESSYQKR